MNWNCINYGINCNDAIVIRDTILCNGFLLFAIISTLIWGRLSGYNDKEKNLATTKSTEGLIYMIKVCVIVTPIMLLIFFIVGQIFG